MSYSPFWNPKTYFTMKLVIYQRIRCIRIVCRNRRLFKLCQSFLYILNSSLLRTVCHPHIYKHPYIYIYNKNIHISCDFPVIVRWAFFGKKIIKLYLSFTSSIFDRFEQKLNSPDVCYCRPRIQFTVFKVKHEDIHSDIYNIPLRNSFKLCLYISF
jgi:hypothetical protein